MESLRAQPGSVPNNNPQDLPNKGSSGIATCQSDISRLMAAGVSTIDVRGVPFTFTKDRDNGTPINACIRIDYESMGAWSRLLKERGTSMSEIKDLMQHRDPSATLDIPEHHVPIELLSADEPTRTLLEHQVFVCPCFNVASFEIRTCRRLVNDQVNRPLARRLFEADAVVSIEGIFENSRMRGAIEWGFALMHEASHALGQVAVAPTTRDGMMLEGFWLDVAGELTTDCFVASVLFEHIPELTWYTVAQRGPGHWSRRKFSDNPVNSCLNSDNDSLVAATMFGKLIRSGAYKMTSGGRACVDIESVARSLDELAEEVSEAVRMNEGRLAQEFALKDVIRRYVPMKGGIFVLTSELIEVFDRCRDLPVLPSLALLG